MPNEPPNETSPLRKRLRRVEPTAPDVALPQSNKKTNFTWSKDNTSGMIPIFPEPNYEDCRNIMPHQQFEKYFDENLLNYIIDASTKYAIYCNKPDPKINISELKTLIAVLIISGYNHHSSLRNMWSQDDDLKNVLVSNSIRRNRYQEILRFIHFEDSGKGGTRDNPNPDKLWKLRPLMDHVKAKMLEHFHPEQNLSYDESMIAYFGKHGCKQFIKGIG